MFSDIMHNRFQRDRCLFPVYSRLGHHEIDHVYERRPGNLNFPFHKSIFDYRDRIQKHAMFHISGNFSKKKGMLIFFIISFLHKSETSVQFPKQELPGWNKL
jgi:hypothetical protein